MAVVGSNDGSNGIHEWKQWHPSVAAVGVVAKSDEKWGEKPCAFIELNSGFEENKVELLNHCKENLAGFKVPKFFIFCELPKTSTGKIQKFVLREKAEKLD